jgi:DNA-binding GntR family transcriptional regulator
MTPAREAVRRLAAEGALQLSLSGRITTPALSNDRIEELATLRALLEPELAARALPRATSPSSTGWRSSTRAWPRWSRGHDAPGYIRMNLEFHRMLYLRAQSPRSSSSPRRSGSSSAPRCAPFTAASSAPSPRATTA